MGRIRLLDENTINQIAAGEVIENPASVVKELVENAIDAGASEIEIETKGGGRSLIRVADNGMGMAGDDLLLSLERHATSKIAYAEQLSGLKTLGFRGEALPSIASVSRMRLHSASQPGEGNAIEIEGGKVGKLTPLPRKKGTSIEVFSLFFNVPVRRKFQKTVGSDTAEISKILTQFVLSYPQVGFAWRHDNEERWAFSPQDTWDKRIETLLGSDFLNETLPVEHSHEPLSLKGVISKPSFHRPNRAAQYLFINGRSVSSSWVARQVGEAYGTRLPTHRYPLFALHLTLPPAWVDVNVHPQKREVRLRKEEILAPFIREAALSALEKREAPAAAPCIVMPALNFTTPLMAQESGSDYRAPLKSEGPQPVTFTQIPLFSPTRSFLVKMGDYFLYQEEEGIRLVHGPRASECLLYHELTEKKERRAIQTLLLPIHLTVQGDERLRLENSLSDLNEKGIAIRHFGGESFVIEAIPDLLESHEVPDLIFGYLAEKKIPLELQKCLKRNSISKEAGLAIIERFFHLPQTEFTPNGKKVHTLLNGTVLDNLL